MLRKVFAGDGQTDFWILSGDIPVAGGLVDATALSFPLSSNSSYSFMAGAGDPSSDGTISCYNDKGSQVWSKAVTEDISGGSGQFSGFASAADENYVVGVHEIKDVSQARNFNGVVQCRNVDDGSLVWQKQITNGRPTSVTISDGFAYVGLTADQDHLFNYARFNLSNGSVSATGRAFQPSGNPMRLASDDSSNVYFLTTDGSVTGDLDDNTQLGEISPAGSVQASVKFDDGFATCSYVNSTRADLAVRRDSSVDYVYTFTGKTDNSEVNVVKFSNVNGSSSTVDWQVAISRTGWTRGTFLNGCVDSDGNAYFATQWGDGGGNSEIVIFYLDEADGSLIKALSITSTRNITPIRGVAVQGNGLVVNLNTYLYRLPLNLTVSGTFGDETFSDSTDYTVSSSAITFSNGTVSSVSDSYSFFTSSYDDANSGSTVSKTTIVA